MIISGEDRYIPALMQLWRYCFPSDTEAFIQFYFTEVYKNEETLIYLHEGQAAASMQIIPYPVKTEASISLSGYISGAMTHPDYRRRGFMEQLLQAAFDLMREKEYASAFLIPQEDWLFSFYGKYGYKKAFPVNKPRLLEPAGLNYSSDRLIIRDKTVNVSQSLAAFDFPDFYNTYYRFLTEMPYAVLKTKQQVKLILTDLFLDRGTLFHNDWGLALTLPSDGAVLVKEYFYHDEEIRIELLKAIEAHYQTKTISILNDPESSFARHKGMIKSLNGAPENTGLYLGLMLD